MKKIFILPLLAMVALVSQVWADPCVANGQKVFCQWSASGCWQVNSQPATGPKSTCEIQAGFCPALYSGGTEGAGSCTSFGNSSFTMCNGCWAEENSVWCDYGPEMPDGTGGCHQKTPAECSATSGTAVPNQDACGTGNANAQYCYWGAAGGCHKIADGMNADHPEMTNLQACQAYGKVSTSSTCDDVKGGTVQYCNWGPCINGSGWNCEDGGCYELTGDPTTDCTAKSGTIVSSCPAGTLPPAANGGGQQQCPSGTSGTYPNCTCNNGAVYPGCTSTPIIVGGRSVGLTVVPNGNVLYIISEKSATVELFSMAGVKVLTSKITKGNSTLSLEKQKQGVYYAVVKSGSQKQTVKVVLK